MRPLVILVADKQMEEGLKAFFAHRGPDGQPRQWHFKLGCAPFPFAPDQDIIRDPESKDPELFRDCAELLRTQRRTYERALVILDRQFPGTPAEGATAIRERMLPRLHASGWAPGTVEVVVIEPCLEAWLWSDDVHVESAFGHRRPPSLRDVMANEGLWPADSLKPVMVGSGDDLKFATRFAANRGGQKLETLLFRKVFGSPRNLDRCTEPGFLHLCAMLQRWFPLNADPESNVAPGTQIKA